MDGRETCFLWPFYFRCASPSCILHILLGSYKFSVIQETSIMSIAFPIFIKPRELSKCKHHNAASCAYWIQSQLLWTTHCQLNKSDFCGAVVILWLTDSSWDLCRHQYLEGEDGAISWDLSVLWPAAWSWHECFASNMVRCKCRPSEDTVEASRWVKRITWRFYNVFPEACAALWNGYYLKLAHLLLFYLFWFHICGTGMSR